MTLSNVEAIRAVVLGDEERMKYHPLSRVQKDLETMLSGPLNVSFTEDYDVLLAERSRDYELLVAYTDRWDAAVTEEQAEGLISFVRNGGGLVVLHTGVSLSIYDKLHELIGARFIGHPPYQKLSFQRVEEGNAVLHPIVRELEPFESEDEPYRYAMLESTEKQVIVEYRQDGVAYPAAWVRHEGRGRIVSLMPGHNANSLQHPEVRKLILSACLWAAGRLD
ncbi:ThuA domain-containing protein [Paenibacillus sp. H1-7]|uniref:ThuA domain-containing protein n=1 Tax=Paenibacillus sp. H1-7 TaxID=2282849 RepID=UPI001EF94460|nr:ThuA domain-containing protein [Paenibacillus sp. H1-7]